MVEKKSSNYSHKAAFGNFLARKSFSCIWSSLVRGRWFSIKHQLFVTFLHKFSIFPFFTEIIYYLDKIRNSIIRKGLEGISCKQSMTITASTHMWRNRGYDNLLYVLCKSYPIENHIERWASILLYLNIDINEFIFILSDK